VKLKSRIEADFNGGVNSGMTGTPTFYINGEKYVGDWGDDELINHLKKLVE